jgi:hypothetical protein
MLDLVVEAAEHTELAGTTDKRPAAPLVPDEEAASSNPADPVQIKTGPALSGEVT